MGKDKIYIVVECGFIRDIYADTPDDLEFVIIDNDLDDGVSYRSADGPAEDGYEVYVCYLTEHTTAEEG